MKLFYSPTSPYARKVRIMIIELGLEEDVTNVAVATHDDPLDLQSANPIGKVPTLVLGNGQALFDSRVICEFLDAENGNRFIPESGEARWDCLRRQALAEGVIDASYLRTVENGKTDAEHSIYWTGRFENSIVRSLMMMKAEISDERFDMGDVACACALGYLDLRHGDMNWRRGNGKLAHWFETVCKRESVANTIPPES